MKLILNEVLIRLSGEEMKQLSEELEKLSADFREKCWTEDNPEKYEEMFPICAQLEGVWWDFPENKKEEEKKAKETENCKNGKN